MKKKNYVVITGDIVQSTSLSGQERVKLAALLSGLQKKLSSANLGVASAEVIRGDSFQLVLDEPARGMETLFLIRAYFRSVQINESIVLDARLGMGIGPIEYKRNKQNESDGTAFRLAAKALEETEKPSLSRMHCKTESEAINRHLNAVLVACEMIIGNWTSPQAKAMWWSQQGLTQTEIAGKLHVAQPTVTRALRSAGDKTIQYIIGYSSTLLHEYLESGEILKMPAA
jgi:hypothetical protein